MCKYTNKLNKKFEQDYPNVNEDSFQWSCDQDTEDTYTWSFTDHTGTNVEYILDKNTLEIEVIK